MKSSTERKAFAGSLLAAFTISLGFFLVSGEAFAQSQSDELYVVAAGQFIGQNMNCTYGGNCSRNMCAEINYNSLNDPAKVPTNECSGELTATRQLLGGGGTSYSYTYEGRYHFNGNITADNYTRTINETLSFFVLGDAGTYYNIFYNGTVAAAAEKGAEDAPGCYLGTAPGSFSADVWSPAAVHVETATAQTSVNDSKRFSDRKNGQTTAPVITVGGKRYSFAFQINVKGQTLTNGYCVKKSEGQESFKIFLGVQLTASSKCPIPTGEHTQSGGWELNPSVETTYDWRAVLEPASIDFSGRLVRERDAQPGWDSCNNWARSVSLFWPYSPTTGVTGGPGTSVAKGNIYDDQVGYLPWFVLDIRALGGLPGACYATIYQQMQMYCDADGQWHNYKVNILRESIGITQVGSERDGHKVSKRWP